MIFNASDQIEGFTQEVVSTVKNIQKQYNMDKETSIKMVELAIRSITADAIHHLYFVMEDIGKILNERNMYA